MWQICELAEGERGLLSLDGFPQCPGLAQVAPRFVQDKLKDFLSLTGERVKNELRTCEPHIH